jgi:hypothetical protein
MSLEELTGSELGESDDAPTPLVASVLEAWKKPLRELSKDEIGDLLVQQMGFPYLLDLVWPKLEADPLFDAGYYPGDVLANLIRAEPSIWADRPEYQIGLISLYERALARPADENDAFREILQLPRTTSSN